MIYAKLAALVALLAAIVWIGIADYQAGKKAGADTVQLAWDKDKASIQAITDAAIAQATKERDAALQNNAQVIDDKDKQINANRVLLAGLADRLRDAEIRAAASGSSLLEANHQLGLASGSLNASLGQINAAVADTINECGANNAKYTALVKELKPQL